MGFFGGSRAVLNEMTAAQELARTTRGIGDQRAQMFIGAGGLLKSQYAGYEPVTIANLTQPASTAAAVPTGAVFQWVLPHAPVGFLLCDGRAVSKTEYRELFELIGTMFGEGGAGEFRLPNMGGRVPVGAGSPSFPDAFTGSLYVGATGGSPAMEISSRNMPEHSHGISALEHSHTLSSHDHSVTGLVVEAHTHLIDFTTSSAYDVVGNTYTDLSHDHSLDVDLNIETDGPRHYTDADGTSNSVALDLDHTHPLENDDSVEDDTVTVSSGGGHSHAVASSGTAASGGAHFHDIASSGGYATITSDGAHTHSVDIDLASDGAHGHTATFDADSETESDGAHTHAVSVGSAGAHVHDITTTIDDSGDYIVVDDGGAHTHSVNIDTDTDGVHGHTFTGSNAGMTGSAGAHSHIFDLDDVGVEFDHHDSHAGDWDTDITIDDNLSITTSPLDAAATGDNLSSSPLEPDDSDVIALTDFSMTDWYTWKLDAHLYDDEVNSPWAMAASADGYTTFDPTFTGTSNEHIHNTGLDSTDHGHNLNGTIGVEKVNGVVDGLSAGLVVDSPEPNTTDGIATASVGGHYHSVGGDIDNTDGGHAHDVDGDTGEDTAGHTHTISGATESAGDHDHSATAAATWTGGGTSAHTHSIDAESIGVSIDSSDGGHTHDVDGDTGEDTAGHTHTLGGTTETDGAHEHSVSTTGTAALDGGHTHSFDFANALGNHEVGRSSDDLIHHHTLSSASAGGTSGSTTLDHYHVLDDGNTGFQDDVVLVGGSLGDSGTLTTDDVTINAGTRTETEGQAYPDRMEVMQPYLVLSFIIKAGSRTPITA